MSNAAKLKKKAAEFEQKKQFDKALQLYIQILDEGDDDEGEGDVALYNRVGDLLMRQGNVGDAMTYYEKAVDLYAESGFFNNAIALCNKILRQSPGRNSVYYKLGKISAKKGFISDAKQNFLEYASRMQSSGHLDEAFRALKEFADLCPDQDDIRLMLAEQLSKKDRKREALEQLQLLYEKFEAEGRGEDMQATVNRMRAIDPAAEPKAGAGIRSQKSSDLIFLDLSDSGDAKNVPADKRAVDRKPAAGAAVRRSGEARKTVPVVPEPEAPAESSDSASAPDDDAEAEVDDGDLLPLPPIGESESVVDGLESTAPSVVDGSGRDRVQGFESSALDDELRNALDAALPDVEPPLSGQQFAALRLATPLNVPALMPPAHDLALPGELPPISAGERPVLSLTDEMELIIPDGDAPVSPSTQPGQSAGPTNATPSMLPGAQSGPLARQGPAHPDALPMIEVDHGAASLGLSAGKKADDELSFVGGADLLDVPDIETAPEEGLGENAVPTRASTRRPSNHGVADPSLDDPLSLASWLDETEGQPSTNGVTSGGEALDIHRVPGATGSRRSGTVQSHSPLARSVDQLRAQVDAEPINWALRRQLAEALLDAGDREGGLQVLEAAMVGLERAQDLEVARSVADEIIRLIPNSVRHHQKRVEYAFRTNDRARLPQAYLELADALFRSGQADKARAVYQRVLELSPDDPRAQAALSTFGDEFLDPLIPLDGAGSPENATAADGPPLDNGHDAPAVVDGPIIPPTPASPPALPRPAGQNQPAVPPAPARPGPTAAAVPASPPPAVPPRGGKPAAARPGAPLSAPPAAPPPAGRAAGRVPPPQPAGRPDGKRDLRPLTRPEPTGHGKADSHQEPKTEQKPAGRPDTRQPDTRQPARGPVRPPARPDVRPGLRPEPRPNAAPAGRGPVRPGAGPARPPAGAASAPPSRDAAPPGSAESESTSARDSFINLGDWLRDDDAPRSTRMVVEEEKPSGDEAADFADMLRKFKQGIAENVSEEDHESHYDLGVAYKEMGLVDEAVAEFQKALRGHHRVRTYEALGQCFIEKQQFQVAATILSRALTETNVSDDQLVGVLYLLGYASEALMRWEAAVGYYQRVFAVDIRFRDAAQRLAALERAPR